MPSEVGYFFNGLWKGRGKKRRGEGGRAKRGRERKPERKRGGREGEKRGEGIKAESASS